MSLQDGHCQAGFGREMVMDAGLSDTDLVRDVGIAESGIATLHHQGVGRPQDFLCHLSVHINSVYLLVGSFAKQAYLFHELLFKLSLISIRRTNRYRGKFPKVLSAKTEVPFGKRANRRKLVPAGCPARRNAECALGALTLRECVVSYKN